MNNLYKKNEELIQFNLINFNIQPKETINQIKKIRDKEEIEKYGKKLTPQQRYYHKKKNEPEFKVKNAFYAKEYYKRNKNRSDFMDGKRINAITYYYKKKNNLI
jgi:hypothetical protein